MCRKISPTPEGQNVMFNKNQLLKSCHCKDILMCVNASLKQMELIMPYWRLLFSPPLEIISHETGSTFFMSSGQWLQRNLRAELQENETRRLTQGTKDKISTILL